MSDKVIQEQHKQSKQEQEGEEEDVFGRAEHRPLIAAAFACEEHVPPGDSEVPFVLDVADILRVFLH